MRQITSKAVQAFYNRKNFTLSNTSVEVEDGVVKLKLHGNTIAGIDHNGTWITDAGWPTRTTFERLKGLDDVSIYTKRGQVYLNDEEWDGEKVYIN